MNAQSKLVESLSREEPALPDASSLRGHVLLAVVDDEIRAHVNQLLASYYRVTIVSDGSDAIHDAIQSVPHLILVDVATCDASGTEMWSALRENSRTASIPLLVLSADAIPASGNEGANVVGIIDPYDSRELLGRVGEHLAMAILAANATDVEKPLHAEAKTPGITTRRIDFSHSASPNRDEAGRMISASNVTHGIGEHSLAEAGDPHNEHWLRTFAINVPVAMFIKDLEGRYLYANPLACEALGRPEGVIGMTDHDLLPAEVASRLRGRDSEVIATGRPNQWIDAVARDGFHRDYLTVKFPLTDSERRTVGVCGIATDITERNRDHESLCQSEEQFRTLASNAPVGIFLTDSNGQTVFVNESWCAMAGLAPAQAKGSGWMKAIHPEDREWAVSGWTEAVRRGATSNADFRFLRPDGIVTWLQGSAVPLRDPSGQVSGYIGTVMDITDRKRAEEELTRAQEQLQLVTESMAVAVTHCTADLRYEWANPGYASLLGRSRDEIVSRPILEIIGPEAFKTLRPYIERVLEGEKVEYEALIDYQNADGRWIKGAYVPTYSGKSNVPDGWVAVIHDITEEKRKEEALRTSEQLYRAIGESNDYGVWVCDPLGRNIYASDSFLQLVGLSQEECSNFGWTKVLHPDDVERTITAWNECVHSGGIWDVEHRFLGVDGKWHPILARGVPVRNERGEITAWAGINLDISRLKQVEDELRQADRRKDEFLAVLAHELRNPLAPIRTGLELMRLAGDDHKVREEVRATMQRQVQQMARLIDDLMDVSRITRGIITLRKRRVDLASIVRSAVETSRPVIDESKHQLTVSLPDKSVFLDADPTRLAQVISNLLNNAAKFTEPGGNVELITCREGDMSIVTVKDSGVGIPAGMLNRVFEMFTQVDRSRERSQSGLGIGLTLVKRLVEMHGGTVEARSNGPGQGSEFIIRLPIAKEFRRDDQPDKDQDAGCCGKRILIADDNESAARLLAMLLTKLGNDVRTAHDGQTAFNIASEFRPELALLDLGMPKLDGYETARRIRHESWGQEMVLAALTGWGQEEDKQRTKEAGFNYHFIKPIEPNVLQQLLAE